MKTKLFITAFIVSIATSCQKEPPTENLSDQMSSEEITNKMLDAGYNIEDVLDFLEVYGTTTPDVLPAFNNYYQDIGEGGSNLGQLSLVNEELFINNLGELIVDTSNYTFNWYINNTLQCSETNPKLWDLNNNLQCDGVVNLTLEIVTPSEAIYSRDQWAFLDYNEISNCNCAECPSLFEVFYTFYPDVEPYHYQISPAKWDLNSDQIINSNDLLILLQGYGN